MTHRVTLVPGDGIGPEVVAAARLVLESTGVEFEWDRQLAGQAALEALGTTLPTQTVESVRACGVALKGPTTTVAGTGERSANLELRRQLDLFAGIRPCRTFAGVPAAFADVDVVIVRMTQEDLYAGIEFAAGDESTERLRALVQGSNGTSLSPDTGISLKPLSASGALRVARAAFGHANENQRSKITAVHKATVMHETDGVFLECVRRVGRDEYPTIELDDVLVDTLCSELVRHPARYDVLVLPMQYGDLISDLCAGLIGGLGLAPGANIGDRCAVFEPVHGSAPRYAGRDRANPLAMVLSGALLLRHIGEDVAADLVADAVASVLAEQRVLTYDLTRDAARAAGTAQMAEAVAERVAA